MTKSAIAFLKKFQSTGDERIASFPFYYGWVILFVGTLGIILAAPGDDLYHIHLY